MIYLDNNATTAIDPFVFEAMRPYLQEKWGNPSSPYQFGTTVMHAIDIARESVAVLVGAQPEEILFTASGTESDNAAIFSALRAFPSKRHIIITKVEHPAVLTLCEYLETQGYSITYLPVDKQGQIDLALLMASITEDTALISVMMANNETGILFPIEEIAAIARDKGVLFHTDAVQAVGKIPIDVYALGVDLLSFSGHKLHAPKGIGVLYIRCGVRFFPFIHGGNQERERRGGTENVAAIVALGKACRLAKENQLLYTGTIAALRDQLETGLCKAVPDVMVHGRQSRRLGNTVSVSFKYIEGEALLLMLDEQGVCASSGSACAAGSLEPSHVLRAMEVPHDFVHGTLRLSLSKFNSREEIDTAVRIIPGIIARLRSISPFCE